MIGSLRTLADTNHADGILSQELGGFAAESALGVVLDNWNDAMKDGEPLSELVSDIDDVCEQLLAFKAAAEKLARADSATRIGGEFLAAVTAFVEKDPTDPTRPQWEDVELLQQTFLTLMGVAPFGAHSNHLKRRQHA